MPLSKFQFIACLGSVALVGAGAASVLVLPQEPAFLAGVAYLVVQVVACLAALVVVDAAFPLPGASGRVEPAAEASSAQGTGHGRRDSDFQPSGSELMPSWDHLLVEDPPEVRLHQRQVAHQLQRARRLSARDDAK